MLKRKLVSDPGLDDDEECSEDGSDEVSDDAEEDSDDAGEGPAV